MPNPWSIYALIPFVWLALILIIGTRIAIAGVMADFFGDGYTLGYRIVMKNVQHFQVVRETTQIKIEMQANVIVGQQGYLEKTMFKEVIAEIREKIDKQVTITDGPSRPGVWRVEANAFVIHPDVFIPRKEG